MVDRQLRGQQKIVMEMDKGNKAMIIDEDLTAGEEKVAVMAVQRELTWAISL